MKRNLYSKLKIFHQTEKLYSLPRDKTITPPIHIRIKPTNVCAHNCWYCAYRTDNDQLGEDINLRDNIPREKMLEIIDDISDMGVKAVTFSGGGDPFYYPYFKETLEKIVNTDIKFASLTNGARLKGDLAKIFSEHATWIRISVDGWDDASYADYRQIKSGRFTELIDNLTKFKELGGSCLLGVAIIVDKDNAPHIYEMIDLFHSIGVDSIKVSACLVSDDVDEINLYHDPFRDMVVDQIEKAEKDFASDDFEIYNAYYEITSRFKKDYNWCPFSQIVPVIGADMNVYSCHDKAYTKNGLLGSIEKTRFKDLWYGDKEGFFSINPEKDCNHHCMMNAQNKSILSFLESEEDHLDFI